MNPLCRRAPPQVIEIDPDSGLEVLGEANLMKIYNDGNNGTGNRAEMAMDERMELATEGIVIASIEVRPVVGVDSPASRVDFPAGGVDFRAGRTASPAGRIEFQAGRADFPASRVNLPAGRVDFQASRVDFPVGGVDFPPPRRP